MISHYEDLLMWLVAYLSVIVMLHVTHNIVRYHAHARYKLYPMGRLTLGFLET